MCKCSHGKKLPNAKNNNRKENTPNFNLVTDGQLGVILGITDIYIIRGEGGEGCFYIVFQCWRKL